jgi:hypothetical protein
MISSKIQFGNEFAVTAFCICIEELAKLDSRGSAIDFSHKEVPNDAIANPNIDEIRANAKLIFYLLNTDSA